MSAADVTYYNRGEICGPDQATHFGFTCPKTGKECHGWLIAGRTSTPRDGQNQNGGRAQWDLIGPDTFSPSLNDIGGCGWHGFIEKGRCLDTSKRDEP